jgi:hypothetical protein
MEITVAQAQMIGHKTRGFQEALRVNIQEGSDHIIRLQVLHVVNEIDVDGYTRVYSGKTGEMLDTHTLADWERMR